MYPGGGGVAKMDVLLRGGSPKWTNSDKGGEGVKKCRFWVDVLSGWSLMSGYFEGNFYPNMMIKKSNLLASFSSLLGCPLSLFSIFNQLIESQYIL